MTRRMTTPLIRSPSQHLSDTFDPSSSETDFTMAATRTMLQDPDKLSRLVRGFQCHDFERALPGFRLVASEDLPPARTLQENSLHRPRLLPAGDVTPREAKKMEQIEVEILGQVSSLIAASPTATESDETAPAAGERGKSRRKNRKKKKGKKAIVNDDEELQIDEDEVEALLQGDSQGSEDLNDEIRIHTTLLHSSPDQNHRIIYPQADIVHLPALQEKDSSDDITSTDSSTASTYDGKQDTVTAYGYSEEEHGFNLISLTPHTNTIQRIDSSDVIPPNMLFPSTPPILPPSYVDISGVIPEIKVFTPDQSRLPTPPMTTDILPIRRMSVTEHPLSQFWTLYFSDTSEKARLSRKVSAAVLVPRKEPPANPKVEEYSSGLIPLFTSCTVENLLGSWKALRRSIARAKSRIIEPEGMPIEPLTGGIGSHLMPHDTNFHLFVDGIKPMWEDPRCARGGKIMMTEKSPAMLDHGFLEVCLLLIGGTVEDACPLPSPTSKSMICGVAISRRQLTRIEIWLGGGPPPELVWIETVTKFFERTFPTFKVYGYKAFGK